jgi:hypothetical protein
MPTFLSDPTTTSYLLAVGIAVVGLGYWYRTQTRKSVRVACLTLLVPITLTAIDYGIESPREEAVRRVGLLLQAFNSANPDGVTEQLANTFRYGTTTKAITRTAPIWGLIREHRPRVAAWDFDRGYVDYPTEGQVRIGCMVKVELAAGGTGLFFFRPLFVREADGAHRLQSFDVHTDALQKSRGPIYTVPGLP